MTRKTKKIILLIFGFILTAVFTGIFVENLLRYELGSGEFWTWFIMQMSAIFIAGFIPIDISMRMHAKDIMIENERLSKFLKVISVLLILIGVIAVTIGPMIFNRIYK